MAFKPGDKVKRIGNAWHACKNGDIVTVVQVMGNDLTCKEHPQTFAADMFVLVDGEAVPVPVQFNVGDKVSRKLGHCNGMWPTTDVTYTVMQKRAAVNPDGTKTYKIRVMGKEGFWYADKFSLSGAAPAQPPAPFVPAVGVVARIKAGGLKTAGIPNIEQFHGATGVITEFSGHRHYKIGVVTNQWWFLATDLESPDGEAYVPPPVRKIKVYNAERKSHV